ncbi:hypothetical protein [Novosphingobium beihaiensis]|uniref:Uncharacterized protein n=1 Tax=Novosphingobium beihaiensis TaxID=2930389 RepID=A0ABT0BK64_9SPHN|nr:hypothetical protein [Novosphingobium beihaiensis]MCJ2185435.1 hypothetical protein [Novosphingobium beihaiensis]
MALAASMGGGTDTAGDLHLQGRCAYNAVVRAQRGDTVLVTCDTVDIDLSADAGSVVYSRRSWDVTMLRVEGEWEGDSMTVRHMVLRNGTSDDAKGMCRIFRREGRVSVVSCLAKMGTRSYAANFETSRINN